MRGILAAAGAVTLAAMSAAPTPNVMLTANVLTVTGYTAYGTIHFDMDELFQGAFCSATSGNSCTPVRYLSGIPGIGESDGLRALTSALRTTAGPTSVLGFSQGALISTEWIRENNGKAGAPDPEDLSFVLVANPLRKYGGVRADLDIGDPTPDHEYSVLDIAVEYDGAADFPDNPLNLLALANAFAGFQYVHIYQYDDIDLENSEKLVWTEGNTTYVLIRSQNIPLLEPLRILGLHELADRLNDPLKAIIDSAYDRDYPGLVDPASHDDVLQQISANTGDGDAADTPIFTSLVSERTGRSEEFEGTSDPEITTEPDTDADAQVEVEVEVEPDETDAESSRTRTSGRPKATPTPPTRMTCRRRRRNRKTPTTGMNRPTMRRTPSRVAKTGKSVRTVTPPRTAIRLTVEDRIPTHRPPANN